jgi:hypothetical protein
MIAMAAIIDTGMPAATQKRRARVQEQEQEPHDEREAHRPVLEQDVEPPGDRLGPRADEVERHARGQPALHLGRDLLDRALDADRVALLGPVDPHGDGGVVAHEVGAFPVHALDPHGRHVAHGQRRPVGVGAEHDRRDLVGRPLLHPRPHAGGPGDLARRVRRRLGRDGVGDLAHGHVVPDELERRHLDDRLGRGDALDRRPRDAFREEPHDELVGEAGKLAHVHRAP